jgi:para-nitrobenzyl esterase
MRCELTGVVAVLLVAILTDAASAADRVTTSNGVVEGAAAPSGVRIFKGIPFAAPPVGDLRWKPPQPAKPWDGVKETKAFALAPVHKPFIPGFPVDPKKQSEDCLYLNVWTPGGCR